MKPAVIPIRNVNGQMELFSPELTEADLRELLAGLQLKGDRDGLFTEVSEQIVSWP
jgi:hypothetical protein